MLEDTNNLDEKDVCNALRFAVDKVMSEGSLYSKNYFQLL